MIIAEITIVIVKIIDNDLLNFLFISIPPKYLFVQNTHNYCLDVRIIVYLHYNHIYDYCQVQNLILPLNTGDIMIKYTPFWETLEKSNESTYTLINKHKADKNNIIQISTFPRINNDGGYLAITTNEEKPRIIDKCIYSDKMHNEGVRNQGVSLEKKSPELKSALKSNWSSSKNATGGTPGRKNEQE